LELPDYSIFALRKVKYQHPPAPASYPEAPALSLATVLPVGFRKSPTNTNLLTTKGISAILSLVTINPEHYRNGDSPVALTKNDVVDKLQSELGFPRKQSIETVEALIELVKATLASGDDVLVSGFGKFSVKTKHQRKGRNPATGEDLMLDPRKVVTFKCSGKLRDKVNRG
jgi:integration host factor subunit alpha